MGVTAGYGGEPIIRDVSFSVGWGEVAVVIGPNGAGKSTLLKAVMGILTSRDGEVVVDGTDVSRFRPYELARCGVAYVPQVNDIFGRLSVTENLEMGGYQLPRSEHPGRVEAALEMFPVLGKRRRQRADTLSGGERKMLAIGLASMIHPKVLLLDEPTANLSATLGNAFLEEHVRRVADRNISVVLVEQRAVEALAIGDAAYVMVGGTVVSSGPASTYSDSKAVANLFLSGAPVSG